MASSQGDGGTPQRKARRSWFDTPPALDFQPAVKQGSPTDMKPKKRRSLDAVETLILTHFTSPPKISFGKIILGRTKLRTLLIRNPHDYEQEVVIERFPFKKNFTVQFTTFTVEPHEVFSLEIEWTPVEEGGYREMILFYVNEIYRLQAFMMGTAEKPKPPKKVRKHPLGPRVRQPPSVLQTPALTQIKSSYSPRRSQEMRDLMSEVEHSRIMKEDKENVKTVRSDKENAENVEFISSQESRITVLESTENKGNTERENNQETFCFKAPTEQIIKKDKKKEVPMEEELVHTPTPLESTAICLKQEEESNSQKHRRQWRTDIASPTTLNTMSPIPLSEENENGIIVDSYFQANESKVDKGKVKPKENGTVVNSIASHVEAQEKNENMKETFIVPGLASNPHKNVVTGRESDINAIQTAENATYITDKQSITHTIDQTMQKMVVVSDTCTIQNKEITKPESPKPQQSARDVERIKRMAWSSPQCTEPKNTSRTSPVSPNTMLNESLNLIHQMKLPGQASPEGTASMNSSIISQGMGLVSPNSFMEDMKAMEANKSKGSAEIPSPSSILANAIPHNAVLGHLRKIRRSLSNSPCLGISPNNMGTPKKPTGARFAPKRRSISSQFKKEQDQKVAAAAAAVKKDLRKGGNSKEDLLRRVAVVRKAYSRAPDAKKGRFASKPGTQQKILSKSSSLSSPSKSTGAKNESDEAKKGAGKKKTPQKLSPSQRQRNLRRKSFGGKDPRTAKYKANGSIQRETDLNRSFGKTDIAPSAVPDVTPVKDSPVLDTGTVVKSKSFETSHNTSGKYFDDLVPENKSEAGDKSETGSNSSLARRGKLFPDIDTSGIKVEEQETVEQNDIGKSQDEEEVVEQVEEYEVLPDSQCQMLKVSEHGTPKKMTLSERIADVASRSLSPQRFLAVSPSHLPTSPSSNNDISRRGTMTVTKSRPSDALLAAMNNRKRLFAQSALAPSPMKVDEDGETTENIHIKVEEHYEEIDGQVYVVIKETTDVVKSKTETFMEQVCVSPGQFQTPPQLPTSPRPELSRRSTHVLRSPKVLDKSTVGQKRLDFVATEKTTEILETSQETCLESEDKIVASQPESDTMTPKQEQTEDANCTVGNSTINSDTFEKDPEVSEIKECIDVASLKDKDHPPITSVCVMSPRIVDYDDMSEDGSADNTKDSLDVADHSVNSPSDDEPKHQVTSKISVQEQSKIEASTEINKNLDQEFRMIEQNFNEQSEVPEMTSDENAQAIDPSSETDLSEKSIDHVEHFVTVKRVQFINVPTMQFKAPEPVEEKKTSMKKLRRSLSADASGFNKPLSFTVDLTDIVNKDGDVPKQDNSVSTRNSLKSQQALPKQSQSKKNSFAERQQKKDSLSEQKSQTKKNSLAETVGRGTRNGRLREAVSQSQLKSGQPDNGMKVRSQSLNNLSSMKAEKKVEKTSVTKIESESTKAANAIAKHKKKAPAKGVAQSKLILVKKNKAGAPRHPMPFAAKNMYYDERWMEKQERGFVQWLNFVLTPPDEYVAVTNKAKVDAGALSLRNQQQVTPRLAPTKEILSFRAYAARRRLNRLRRAACELYQSEAVVEVVRKVEAEVESRRIAARKDKMMHADLGIKQRLLDLLLQYSSLWLRIGLETVFGEVLMVQSNQDILGLSRFIVTRLLSCPDIADEYSHPTVPHLYKDGYAAAVSRHTVKKFLLLVYFLDTAKTSRIIDHDPCLFCKDAEIKNSKEILIQFSREILSGEGDITRHLAYLGYTVKQSQRPIDEFDYAVSSLSSDLKDGIRLGRVLEFLAGKQGIMEKLRAPAISRLQKIHNMELFFKAMAARGLDFESGKGSTVVTARDVVDGHREKTLSLLWKLIIHFQASIQVNEEQLKEEIDLLTKSLRLKLAMQKAGAISKDDGEARRDSGDTRVTQDSERMKLVFQWCRLVGLHYGVRVENFTVSFSDGRALCCLLHHYHPALLPINEINFQTTVSAQEAAEDREVEVDSDASVDWGHGTTLFPGEDNPELYEKLLNNEKGNFKILYEKVSALGGVPMMLKAADMSNTIPDEKVVSTYVAYLCARLLDIREEVRAARVIQMAWRRKRLRAAIRERQMKTKAATRIQQWIRPILHARSLAKHTQAAICIQAHWRGLQARRKLELLKRGRFEKEEKARMESAAIKIQAMARSVLAKRQLTKLKSDLEAERELKKTEKACMKIQALVRSYVERKRFLRKKQAAIDIQKMWRRRVAMEKLKALRHEQQCKSSVKIQKVYRGYLARRNIARMKESTVVLQKNWRRQRAQFELKRLRAERQARAAVTIQKLVRGRKMRDEFQTLKTSALVLQKYWRGKKDRQMFAEMKSKRDNEAAVKIQSYLKASIERKKYMRAKSDIILLQNAWRGVQAKKELARLRNERDNLAATTIQKSFKAFIKRKEFLKTKAACSVLQRFCKMLQAKKELEARRQDRQIRCAIKIQKTFKGYLCRRNLEVQKAAAVLIQSYWRKHVAQNQLKCLKHERDDKAAVVLQKCFRMYKCRQDFLNMKRAALILQLAWRERTIRKLRKERETAAVLLIQKTWRGRKIRAEFLTQRQAACKLQSHWRMLQARQSYWRQKVAACLIQDWYRAICQGERQRCEFQKQKAAAICIQAWWRGRRERQMFLKKKQAAFTIQAGIRCFRKRLKFLALRLAAVIIQKAYRNYRTGTDIRKEFVRQKQAALTIQQHFRAYLAKKRQAESAGATKIQAMFRSHMARKQFLIQRNSAVCIQNSFRGYVKTKEVRNIFLKQKQAAICIQAAFRSYQERSRFKQTVESVIKIQSLVRGAQARKAYLQQRTAVLVIQRRFRARQLGKVFRTAFLLIQKSVIVIQRFYRAYKVAQQISAIMTQNAAATKIQSVYRAWAQRQDFLLLRAATVCLQRRFRAYKVGCEVRHEVQKLRAASLVLQSHWRQKLAIKEAKRILAERKEEERLRIERMLEEERLERQRVEEEQFRCRVDAFSRERAAKIIQKQFQSYRERKEEERRNLAAIVIQKNFRKYVCQKQYSTTMIKIYYLQHLIKGFVIRRCFERQRLAAIIIQRRWREVMLTKTCHAYFQSVIDAAIKIQSLFRMLKQKKDFTTTVQRIVTLQAHVRKMIARRHYLETRRKIVLLQVRVRSMLAMRRDREEFLRQRHSAIKIQSAVRLWLACREATRQRSALTVQTYLRMYHQRKAFLEAHEAALFLQSMYERKLRQLERQSQEVAAFKIQTAFRQYLYRKQELQETAACIIQHAFRKFLQHRQGRRNQAAIVIQRTFKRFLSQKRVERDLAASKIQACMRGYRDRQRYWAIQRSVRLLQASVRGWMARRQVEILRQRHRAVICLQAHLRGYLVRSAFRKFLQHRQGRRNLAAIVIQRTFKRFLSQKRVERDLAASKIQACMRGFRDRQRYWAIQRSVRLLQASVRGWMARHQVEILRQRHRAVICLQAHLRGYLVRRQIQPLLQARRCAAQEERRLVAASVKIQTLWRGYKARKENSSKKMVQARQRLEAANRSATEEKTLGHRTSSALDYLLNAKDLTFILEALMHLETCTRLSPVCCEMLVRVNVVSVLYRLINSCNRSLPHMAIIKYALLVLLNLTKHEKTLPAVIEPEESIATLVELMQIYREKGPIMYKSCLLLGILGMAADRRKEILSYHGIVERLQSIHSLVLRKHKSSNTHQATQAKMAAMKSFNCSLPVQTPSKRKKSKTSKSNLYAKEIDKEFDSPLEAMRFVMDSLQLGAKAGAGCKLFV